MIIFFAITALGFAAFFANLLPLLGQVIVGFFKYVVFPVIIILAVASCFNH